MAECINAYMTTNLDGQFPHTPKKFTVKFPAMPQVGQVFMWGDRRCHIIELRWVLNGMGWMELHVEFNK